MRTSACVLLGLALSVSATTYAQQATPPTPPPRPAPTMPGAIRDGQQDPQKTGTAVLSGRVTETDSGKPVRRALVRASSQETPQGRTVSTDADGRWVLKGLPAGSYMVSISKGGFVDISYGQKRPFEAGKRLELADGQTIDKIDVSLPRAGVVTGRLFDEFGDPVTGARVTAQRYRYVGGQRRLMMMGPGDQTDDIGQFRLHGLAPGEYFVAAAMSPGVMMFGQSDDRVGYTTTFYPGTAVQSEAQRVSVAVGRETDQINMTMASSRIATISGTAVSSSGKPIVRGMLMLTAMPQGTSMMSMGTSLKPDGSFLFSNVAPGEYRVQVQHSPNQDEPIMSSITATEIGSVVVNVTGRDVSGLTVVTSPGATATGKIVFDGPTTPPVTPAAFNLVGAPVEFNAMMMAGGNARVRDDWTFEAKGLLERRRFRVNSPPPGWYLKSATHEGNDITDSGMEFKEGQTVSGIEIVMTQRVSELTGSVQDSRARPVSDYAVVAFSTDNTKWGHLTRYIRAIRPNQDGRFSAKGLPPDDYYVVALDYLESGEENDPEQLDKWKGSATRVTLTDGEQKAVMLKLSQ
jgi:Carboxypeptidase regulatory-like domain